MFRNSLEHVLHLYEGVWVGSIELSSYHGELLASMKVRQEYRLTREDGQPVLLGRFESEQQGSTTLSRSRITIDGRHLLNVITLRDEETRYKGTLEGDHITWEEIGVPASESTTYTDSFRERGQDRALVTRSRSVIRKSADESITVFTNGRFLYEGAASDESVEAWLNKPLEGIPLRQTPDTTNNTTMKPEDATSTARNQQ